MQRGRRENPAVSLAQQVSLGRPQGPGLTPRLPLEHSGQSEGRIPQGAFLRVSGVGAILPLPSHPVPRQDGGETGEEGGLSELGEGGQLAFGKQALPTQSLKTWNGPLWGGGKVLFLLGETFNTRSVLRVRNKGVFLGPVLGWGCNLRLIWL